MARLITGVLILCVLAFFCESQPSRSPLPDPKAMTPVERLAFQRAENQKLPWDQRGEAITPDGPLIREWAERSLAADLYNHDFELEFEAGGRPFQTTQASRAFNRKYRVAIIEAMKIAASRQDKQVAADINLAQVADKAGGLDDRKAASDKLYADLKKLPKSNEPPSFDPNSPWGRIIANLEDRLAYDDKSEKKEKDASAALNKAKAAAGVK
jgi:hypothetical protein